MPKQTFFNLPFAKRRSIEEEAIWSLLKTPLNALHSLRSWKTAASPKEACTSTSKISLTSTCILWSLPTRRRRSTFSGPSETPGHIFETLEGVLPPILDLLSQNTPRCTK